MPDNLVSLRNLCDTARDMHARIAKLNLQLVEEAGHIIADRLIELYAISQRECKQNRATDSMLGEQANFNEWMHAAITSYPEIWITDPQLKEVVDLITFIESQYQDATVALRGKVAAAVNSYLRIRKFHTGVDERLTGLRRI